MDSTHGKDVILTDYAERLIRLKAHQLCKRTDFCSADLDDLQQELWLAVCERIERFDSTKSSVNTFIDLVVNQAIVSILRRRQRLKRDKGSMIQSLDAELEPGAFETFADYVTEDDLARRLGRSSRDECKDRETAESMASTLGLMPERLGSIGRRLMSGTIHSVARDLNISRREVQQACDAIRRYLVQAGFGNS